MSWGHYNFSALNDFDVIDQDAMVPVNDNTIRDAIDDALGMAAIRAAYTEEQWAMWEKVRDELHQYPEDRNESDW